MTTMRSVVAVGSLAVLVACGGGPGPEPMEPAARADALLEVMLTPDPLDRCAARAVLGQRTNLVQRLARRAGHRNPPAGFEPNLSQATALASDAHLFAQSQAAIARGPGNASTLQQAERRADLARQGFEVIMNQVDQMSPSGTVRRSGLRAAEVELAYARVWYGYFEQFHSAARGDAESAAMARFAEWLQTRSDRDEQLLEDYHGAFLDALENACVA
ncbi:MAG: hypothetical protein RH859_03395 [Longimicrobiales bacterium]